MGPVIFNASYNPGAYSVQIDNFSSLSGCSILILSYRLLADTTEPGRTSGKRLLLTIATASSNVMALSLKEEPIEFFEQALARVWFFLARLTNHFHQVFGVLQANGIVRQFANRLDCSDFFGQASRRPKAVYQD